uniref:Uncharacterized protein n=1 Tax=Mustela putorius furo TaxID=9669 RepID=M3YM72_MUSPF
CPFKEGSGHTQNNDGVKILEERPGGKPSRTGRTGRSAAESPESRVLGYGSPSGGHPPPNPKGPWQPHPKRPVAEFCEKSLFLNCTFPKAVFEIIMTYPLALTY